MNCPWCNQKEMRYIKCKGKTVDRQLFEDDYTYVLVPRESHVKHHLIVVLKKKNKGKHRKGLMQCESDDLTHIGKTIYKFCSKLKELPYRYNTVYSGCFSDEGHVHYHLFPLNIKRDKGYKGCAISWLSEKECRSECNSFKKMTHKAKLERLSEIESIVQELIDK
jgi:diadenosine tetraphosphate (Ap4A) HIT family hydrolase